MQSGTAGSRAPGRLWGEIAVERALKSQSLWLTLTYIGLILLMVRGMA